MIVYYLVNTVAASLIAAPHERTIREDLYLSWALAETGTVLHGRASP